MRKVLLIALFIMINYFAYGQKVVYVKMVTSGTLFKEIPDEDKNQQIDLVIKGRIDERDLRYIKNDLKVNLLDLSRVNILTVSGDLLDIYPQTESIVTLPNGRFADMYSDNIKRLILPNNIKRIEDLAFLGYDLRNGVVIPKGVRSIVLGAFSFTRLEDLIIPSKVTTLEANVFLDCKLRTIRFEKGSQLTTLCKGANNSPLQLKNLSEVDLSQCSRLTQCDGELVDQCPQLTKLRLPRNVKHIGRFFVSNCPKLDSIMIEAHQPPSLELEWDERAIIYVPKSSKDNYTQSGQWSKSRIIEWEK